MSVYGSCGDGCPGGKTKRLCTRSVRRRPPNQRSGSRPSLYGCSPR